MPYRPVRPRSIAAEWSLRLGRFALVLGVLSLLLHRIGFLAFDTTVTVLALAVAMALFVAAFALIGFIMLWLIGARGGKAAFSGFIMAVIVLAPAGWAAERYISLPNAREAATDPLDLPMWLVEPEPLASFLPKPALAGQNAAAAAIIADPELTGRRYDGAIDRVIPAVREAAATRKWREVGRDGVSAVLTDLEDRPVTDADETEEAGSENTGNDERETENAGQVQEGGDGVPAGVPLPEARPEGEAAPIFVEGGIVTLQYTATTLILGIHHDIVIRLSEEEETTFVDMRAATREGPHDLGFNAALIRDFLHDLDQRLLGIAGG